MTRLGSKTTINPEGTQFSSCCCCCCQVASVVSNSVLPQRRQPTRLLRPWDSPGKNTGVGCHFLLQCIKVKSKSEVAQSCLTPRDPMGCSPPGSSIHGICQARAVHNLFKHLSLIFFPSTLVLHMSYGSLCKS